MKKTINTKKTVGIISILVTGVTLALTLSMTTLPNKTESIGTADRDYPPSMCWGADRDLPSTMCWDADRDLPAYTCWGADRYLPLFMC